MLVNLCPSVSGWQIRKSLDLGLVAGVLAHRPAGADDGATVYVARRSGSNVPKRMLLRPYLSCLLPRLSNRAQTLLSRD